MPYPAAWTRPSPRAPKRHAPPPGAIAAARPYAQEVLEGLRSGDHLGAVLPDSADDGAWVAPLVRGGLTADERVVVLAGPAHVARALESLGREGIDGDLMVRRGRLSVVPASEIFMRSGWFDGSLALAFADAEIELARAQGYAGLRFVADMRWALDLLADHDRVVSYEAALHALARGRPVTLTCHFDRRVVDDASLRDLVALHPRWVGCPEGHGGHAGEPPATSVRLRAAG